MKLVSSFMLLLYVWLWHGMGHGCVAYNRCILSIKCIHRDRMNGTNKISRDWRVLCGVKSAISMFSFWENKHSMKITIHSLHEQFKLLFISLCVVFFFFGSCFVWIKKIQNVYLCFMVSSIKLVERTDGWLHGETNYSDCELLFFFFFSPVVELGVNQKDNNMIWAIAMRICYIFVISQQHNIHIDIQDPWKWLIDKQLRITYTQTYGMHCTYRDHLVHIDGMHGVEAVDSYM